MQRYRHYYIKKMFKQIFIVLLVALGTSQITFAEESVIEKLETVENKTADKVKSSYRKVEDKVCETVNGKIECVVKKVKNKVHNATDKIKTDAIQMKNKTN